MLSASFQVTIYEKGKSIGRKYLVAGKGGFNLSHNAIGQDLIHNYFPADFLEPALTAFDVKKLTQWYTDLGVETFVGSSNRIFPKKGISPADVLRKIKAKLRKQKVKIK